MRTLTLMDHADLNTLAREILNVIYLPIELGMMAVTNPDSALAWAKEQIVASQGSMFKLVAFFPTIFWVISIAFAFKALAASVATA